MAVAAVNVLVNSDPTDLSTYVTASLSITSGRMYLLTVRSWSSVAGNDTLPTVTGAGQTWDLVDSRLDVSNTRRRLTVFRCIAGSTTSGALTIDFATQVQIMCGWTVDEITGMTPGLNGASAIVQVADGDSNGVSVTSFSVALSAFGNANNAVFAAIFVATATTTITQEAGYTELADNGPTGTSRHETQFLASPDTTPSWTLTSDAVGGAIAVEIAADTAAIPLTAETGAGTDALTVDVGISGLNDTGSGVDALAVGIQVGPFADSGTGLDSIAISAITSLSAGKLWIGRFVNTEPQYTIQDEIINQEQIDEARLRPNVVMVDGEQDSWTEYDQDDLITRDTAINEYLDLPELKSSGDVRQRAVEELEAARRANSPGGDIVWDTHYTRMDRVFWVAEDGSKYEARIEGIAVEFNQSMTPFERATVDTGLMVLCPPDEAVTYLVRDLFERVTPTGLGVADTGGTWVIS